MAGYFGNVEAKRQGLSSHSSRASRLPYRCLRSALLFIAFIVSSHLGSRGDAPAVPERANAVIAVFPEEFATETGPDVLIPFEGNGSRQLTVYNSSLFLSTMPFGATITEIAFRMDEQNRSAFSATLPDIEVRMSTTSSTAPVLPLPFASSVGPDETTVFPRNSFQFTTAGRETGPNPFDLRLSLAQPFFYDPRNGNLAIDLLNYRSASRPLIIDAGLPASGSIQGLAGAPNGMRLVAAPVIQFTFQPIPEPDFLSLFACATAFWWCVNYLKGK